jgi:hypothetical protein
MPFRGKTQQPGDIGNPTHASEDLNQKMSLSYLPSLQRNTGHPLEEGVEYVLI